MEWKAYSASGGISEAVHQTLRVTPAMEERPARARQPAFDKEKTVGDGAFLIIERGANTHALRVSGRVRIFADGPHFFGQAEFIHPFHCAPISFEKFLYFLIAESSRIFIINGILNP